uniref:uncharacterized protein cd8b isoform X2 n=1 Tax=Doryrhamphus excisus TaxID=161450 RepID=UPI0025AE5E9D|nr:uncharacterized protein cd8b isoform X2 [Doryrhamphus excisus]
MLPLAAEAILLMASLWTSGSGQILLHTEAKFLYPELNSTQIIQCDCVNSTCNSVFWFRALLSHDKVQYLGRMNSADRHYYGNNVEKTRFKMSKKNNEAFMLHIINVAKDDAGSYLCILTDRRNQELWNPGVVFLPGEKNYMAPWDKVIAPPC